MPVMPTLELSHRFRHHPPINNTVAATHDGVRRLCLDLALELNRVLPDCDEARASLDAVDAACMLANAAVARRLNYTSTDADVGPADPTAPDTGPDAGPDGDAVPDYVFDLVDAFVRCRAGRPLDFQGHRVPAAVAERLIAALGVPGPVGYPPGGQARGGVDL